MARTIREFQEMQKEFDMVVHEKHNSGKLYQDEKVNANTLMACLVEIGELANEIAFFKYWKLNKVQDKVKILDEFADVMHFVLGLNNVDRLQSKIGSTLEDLYNQTYTSSNLSTLFFKLYKLIVEYKSGEALLYLITIGKSLGFTYQELEDAYDEKHAINYLRQEMKY